MTMELNELIDFLVKKTRKKMKKSERKKIFDEIHTNMSLSLKEDQIKKCIGNSIPTLNSIRQETDIDYSINNKQFLLAAAILETIVKSEKAQAII